MTSLVCIKTPHNYPWIKEGSIWHINHNFYSISYVGLLSIRNKTYDPIWIHTNDIEVCFETLQNVRDLKFKELFDDKDNLY
jgi:hypothetical protein